MKCAAVREQLPLFVAGDLEGEQSSKLQLHLEQCAACASREEVLAEATAGDKSWLRTAVHETTTATPVSEPAVFRMHARVMANLDRKPTSPRFVERALWLAGGALALSGLALLLSTPSHTIGERAQVSVLATPSSIQQPDPFVEEPEADWRRHWRHEDEVAVESMPTSMPPSIVAQSEKPPARTAVELRATNPSVRIIWLVDQQADGKSVVGASVGPSL